MNCNRFKKYLSQLADGELKGSIEEKALIHLEQCGSCSREYNKIVSMKRLLGGDPSYMSLKYDIKIQPEIRYHTGGFSMRKGIIAVCTLVLLTVGIFVPINGVSIAQAIGSWGKSVSFTAYTFEREGETVENKVEVFTNSPMEKDILERDKAIESVKKHLVEKTYSSIEEAKKETSIDFPAPKYMPEGIKLQEVIWSQLTTDPNHHGFLLNYIPDGSGKNILPGSESTNITSIGIAYNIRTDNQRWPGSIINIAGDASVKEINVLGKPGYALTSVLNGVRKLSFRFDMKEYSLEIGIRVAMDSTDDDLVDKMEQELVKITESIMK